MVLFHFSWDWSYQVVPLVGLPVSYWQIVPDMIGGTFFWVSGMSQILSPKDPLREGAKIFGWGMVLTLVSLIYSPNGPIFFGVLHSIGVTKILNRSFKRWSLLLRFLLGIAAIGFGFWLRNLQFTGTWSYFLIWIGFRPNPIPIMADYYPLLPDIGYFWLGSCLASALYSKKKSAKPNARPQPARLEKPIFKPVLWCGKHALTIYIVHQPILFGLTALIAKMR